MERGSDITAAASSNHTSRNPLRPFWNWLRRIFGGPGRAPRQMPEAVAAQPTSAARLQPDPPATEDGTSSASGKEEHADGGSAADAHFGFESGPAHRPNPPSGVEHISEDEPPPSFEWQSSTRDEPPGNATADIIPLADGTDTSGSSAASEVAQSEAISQFDQPEIELEQQGPPDDARADAESVCEGEDKEGADLLLAAISEPPVAPESATITVEPEIHEILHEAQPAPDYGAVARPPRRYRPRLAQPNRNTAERAATVREQAPDALPAVAPAAGAVAARDADLAVSFGAGGWGVVLTLLLRRGADLPDQLTAQMGANQFELFAYGDDYYDQQPLDDARAALADGIAASASGPPTVRWARGGRILHVFAPHSSVAGFVTSSRIQIGVENVVVCTAELESSVRTFIEETGASSIHAAEGPGLPDGWICLRGIRPLAPQQRPAPSPVLQPLVPTPDAAITFEGGIPIAATTWLQGRPPRIGLVGQRCEAGQLLIDGIAAHEVSGTWQAPGWDSIGEHRVSFLTVSRAYSIAAPQVFQWPSTGAAQAVRGAMVANRFGNPAVAVDGYDYVIGARPGDIAPVIRGVAVPEFTPVWAVAGRVRRKLTHVAPMLLGLSATPENLSGRSARPQVRAWCSAIRGVHRDATGWTKDPGAQELWSLYVARAQQCWRAAK